ncbi:hypothetical protein [Streptomyces sp. NPDC059783]|uniref:hypothetical protein n=1 Tax=Streptomyces sp. NPDC059783 TaxID=3346944 RepID=UPI0036587BCF
MLRMFGYDGGAPVHRAYGGIAAADRSVLGVGGDVVDLTVLPRWQDRGAAPRHLGYATAEAWYELLWTRPEDRPVLDGRAPAPRSGAAAGFPPGRMAVAVALARRGHGRAGVLPAPAVIPVEMRLEAAGPVTLEGVPEAYIRLTGGPEGMLAMLRRRQRLAVKGERTVDVFDWAAWGRAASATIRALTPAEVMG